MSVINCNSIKEQQTGTGGLMVYASPTTPKMGDLGRLLYSQVLLNTHDVCQGKTCMCTVFSFWFSRTGKLSAWIGKESWQSLAWSEASLWREVWYRLSYWLSTV